MKSYYRVMLGQGSKFAEKCLEEGFIGADFGYRQDFSNELSDDKNKFIEQFGPEWMERSEKKSKISAGLAAGYTWRICIGIKEGDIILSPDGQGTYLVGEVTQQYNFHSEGPLPAGDHKNASGKQAIISSVSSKLNSRSTRQKPNQQHAEGSHLLEAKQTSWTSEIANNLRSRWKVHV